VGEITEDGILEKVILEKMILEKVILKRSACVRFANFWAPHQTLLSAQFKFQPLDEHSDDLCRRFPSMGQRCCVVAMAERQRERARRNCFQLS